MKGIIFILNPAAGHGRSRSNSPCSPQARNRRRNGPGSRRGRASSERRRRVSSERRRRVSRVGRVSRPDRLPRRAAANMSCLPTVWPTAIPATDDQPWTGGTVAARAST